MNYRLVSLSALILLFGVLLSTQTSVAIADLIHHNAEHSGFETIAMSLNQAVDDIKSKTGGKILSADEKNKDGRRVYVIKVLLPSGQVKIFNIPSGEG